MKILITGGTGFLGQALIEALRAEGSHEIHVIARTPQVIDGASVRSVDITDLEAVNQVVAELQPDWIVHLAADIRRGRDPALLEELTKVNVHGTAHLLRAARLHGVRAFIAAGSYEEYGPIATPFREDEPAFPISPYGVTKAEATRLVVDAGKSGIPAAVIRFPVVYGKGANPSMFIPRVVAAAKEGSVVLLASGSASRDFLHAADAARALVHALKRIDRITGEIINVGTGREVSLLEVIQIAEAVSGRAPLAEVGALEERTGEQFSYVGTLEKAKDLLQFEHEISLEGGLRRLLEEEE